MKARQTPIFRALTVLAALAVAPCHAAAQTPSAADDPGAQAPPTDAAQAPPADVAAGEAGAPPAEPVGEGAPDAADTAPEGSTQSAEAEAQAEPQPEPVPVTGAFGLELGAVFSPCMVAEVLGEEPITYPDADKVQQTGTRYRVLPKVPNSHFNDYTVDVNRDGVVYSVRGRQQPEAAENLCGVTKELAASLGEKYGKPRGRDPFGNWYVFRDMSVDHYRGIRLYSQRCRRGIYEIVYTDDAARLAPPPVSAEASATSGL
jgi:hypothetical protein